MIQIKNMGKQLQETVVGSLELDSKLNILMLLHVMILQVKDRLIFKSIKENQMSFSIKLLSKLLMRLVLVQTREDIVAAWENSLQLQTQLCIH